MEEEATEPSDPIPAPAPDLIEPEAPKGEEEEEVVPIRPSKKAKANGEMQRVAEIVLLLSAMAGVRGGGGRNPTEAEVRLMAEARARLAEICQDLAPKDLVGREAVGAVIEDLGLNWKVKDQRLGFRGSSRLSIKERITLSNMRKMEDPKKFPVPSAMYPPQASQASFSPMAGNHGPSINNRIVPSDKISNMPSPSGGLPTTSPLVHVSTSASTSVTNHSFTTEVRAPLLSAGISGSALGRDSPISSFPRADKTQIKMEGAPSMTPFTRAQQVQANASGSHTPVSASTWPNHHSSSAAKSALENKVTNHIQAKVEVTADSGVPRMGPQSSQSQIFRPTVIVSAQMPRTHQPMQMQGIKYAQPVAFVNNHSEISKIVQKVLQPKPPECPSWTPPSREYMSKALTCQFCKLTVHEVETVILCDSCEKGFHLKCLEASDHKGVPRAEWHCMKCIALSNGKPLPPKYGRVMRSITPPKSNATPAIAQPSPQKNEGTVQRVNQDKVATRASGSQGPAVQSQNYMATINQKVNHEKPGNGASGSVTSHHVQSTNAHIPNSKEVQGNNITASGNDGSAATAVGSCPNVTCLQQNQASRSPIQGDKSLSEQNSLSSATSSDKFAECKDTNILHSLEDTSRAEPSNTAEVPMATSVVAEPKSVGEIDCT